MGAEDRVTLPRIRKKAEGAPSIDWTCLELSAMAMSIRIVRVIVSAGLTATGFKFRQEAEDLQIFSNQDVSDLLAIALFTPITIAILL